MLTSRTSQPRFHKPAHGSEQKQPYGMASEDRMYVQVFFELTGSLGSTGVMVPAATEKSFRAGAVDTFTYPQMPYVGEPQRLRVFTDGAGFFPGWHLK